MGVKGKLIASVEVKCGGHLVHDIFHTKTHHISNICPSKIQNFEIHEGDSVKVGSVVSWKYNDGNMFTLFLSLLMNKYIYIYLHLFGVLFYLFFIYIEINMFKRLDMCKIKKNNY